MVLLVEQAVKQEPIPLSVIICGAYKRGQNDDIVALLLPDIAVIRKPKLIMLCVTIPLGLYQ